jgi:hypothetical protein
MRKIDKALEIARVLRGWTDDELEEGIVRVFCPTVFGISKCEGCGEGYLCQEGWNEEVEE